MFHQYLLSYLCMMAESNGTSQVAVWYRAQDAAGGMDSGKRKEGKRDVLSQLVSLTEMACKSSQGLPAGAGDWGNERNVNMEDWSIRSVGSTGGSRRGEATAGCMMQSWDKTGGMCLEGRRKVRIFN